MSTATTSADSYIDGIANVVTGYCNDRDSVEAFFDKSPNLPNASSLTPMKKSGASDEEKMKAKRKRYQWSTNGQYPPHLSVVPTKEQKRKTDIFKQDRWNAVQEDKLPEGVPQFFGLAAVAEKPKAVLVTMDLIEKKYKELYDAAQAKGGDLGDVYTAKNIGLRPDWFTDAVFAQQHFTGVNPTGLKQASPEWIESFAWAASDQENEDAQQLLANSPSSLYVVDNSDYRYLLGLAPDEVLTAKGVVGGKPCYGAASVTLFSLSDGGKLHPVAICLDYLGSMAESVTIFNKRLTPDAQGINEATEWPWRYAKMCSSMSDWTRHELAVHLTETHLVEEPIIIAAQRSFPDSHIICEILRPHWYKTLSLNFLARKKLVPLFIINVAPLELPQIKEFISKSYTNFDFVGRYAPNDLKSRGFDTSKLDEPKFHNYLYARNISKCWDVLRSFVSDILHGAYPNGDSDVIDDDCISRFCTEMRSQQGAQLLSFPVVKTLEELIDAITMCIHISSPQHTAINYLQQYYLSFVPNRPAAFSAALPTTLAELDDYTERDIIAALPMTGRDMGEWMLMAQVPYLLSAEVDPESNIEEYAESTKESSNPLIAKAGVNFAENVKGLKTLFDKYNEEMDDKVTPYHVLDPKVMARSILI
ncbi:lipoxygenase [Coprinopsis sp. MPI-PUGE-AT-0042]|nr:lipoxygenase [Coprinopsis sp. MPI-PUGE-AT-0042]